MINNFIIEYFKGEETFFKKKAFFPHTPIFKEIATGAFFIIKHSAFDRKIANVRTIL